MDSSLFSWALPNINLSWWPSDSLSHFDYTTTVYFGSQDVIFQYSILNMDNGCRYSDSVLISPRLCDSLITSYNKLWNDKRLEVYPNPADNWIFLEFINEKVQKNFYEIIDSKGMSIKNGFITSYEKIDLNELNNGVYFIKCDEVVEKFIIAR